MKRILTLLFLFPLLARTQSMPAGDIAEKNDGIHWITGLTWEQVKTKARQENKFIFVDAYATWCGPCKKMDKEVYPAGQVGYAVNPRFIAVRLQMDKTEKDPQEVKQWYPVAAEFTRYYQIEGYPSFLFFRPDGKLSYKVLGFRDVAGFIQVVRDALTDPEARYKASLQKFKNSQLEFNSMPELAREARARKDKSTALAVAMAYKQNYLDKLGDDEAFTGPNLFFLVDFSWQVMHSNDRYFHFLFNHPETADSIMNQKRSRNVVQSLILKEEVVDKIYKDGKPLTDPKPNWRAYKTSIRKKYGETFNDAIFPDAQITFYAIAKDWKGYIKYVNEKIKRFPPKVNGKSFFSWGDATGLNQSAWTLFLFCDNKKLLASGLPWIDMAIKLDTSSYSAAFIDTKANLLYRMGKVGKAIPIEEAAVSKSKYPAQQKEFTQTVEKMKKGEPTWPAKEGNKQ